MTDIAYGERSKKILRFLVRLAYKYLKVDMKTVDENLKHFPNPVIKSLNSILTIGANQLKPWWQRTMLKQFGQLALWIIGKDTAYRDVFFWILNEILKKASELQKQLKPYVKPPEKWIPNLWFDSQAKTQQLRKSGEIASNAFSFEESLYVKKMQGDVYNKNMKRKR